MRSSHRSRPIGLPRQRSCLHKSKPRTKPNTSSPPTTTFNPVPHPLRRDQIRRQAQTVNIIEIQFGTAEANRGEHRIVLAEDRMVSPGAVGRYGGRIVVAQRAEAKEGFISRKAQV